jgi:hypothetical protein
LLALGANGSHLRVFSHPSQGGGFGIKPAPDKMAALPVSYHLEAFNPAVFVEFQFHRLISYQFQASIGKRVERSRIHVQ